MELQRVGHDLATQQQTAALFPPPMMCDMSYSYLRHSNHHLRTSKSKDTFFFFFTYKPNEHEGAPSLSLLSPVLQVWPRQTCLKSRWKRARGFELLGCFNWHAIFTEAKILYFVRKTTSIHQSKLLQPKCPVTCQDRWVETANDSTESMFGQIEFPSSDRFT